MSQGKKEHIINDLSVIEAMLSKAKVLKQKIWTWQFPNEVENKKKLLHVGYICAVDFKARSLQVKVRSNKIRFDQFKDLYIYIEEELIAFKIQVKEIGSTKITATLPDKVKKLDPTSNVSLIHFDGDNQNYINLRHAPRTIAHNLSYAIVYNAISKSSNSFPILDLSQGGMGIIIEDPGEFQIGEYIYIIKINAKIFNPKLKAKIVNVHRIKNRIEGEFKVGLQFIITAGDSMGEGFY